MRKASFPSSLRWAILFCLAALIILVPTLVLAQTQTTVSINAGGSATGSFTADQYYSGGSTYTNTATIDMSQITSNPPPAAIFNTERYGAMTYTIPNLSGAQTVTLYFAETFLTGSGQRLFNVTINGTSVLSNFDIYASAGGANRAIARTFSTTANSSGQVVIQFTSVTENPKINGISVTGGSANPTQVPPTGVPPTSVPPASISINTGGSATGSFVADQYYSGGSTYTNTATIDMSQITTNPPPAAIFNTERYGAMTYTIPNRSGAQTVTLYFSENYVTAAGQRLFNVTINGTAALSNFDIYASAGGQNRAIARTFNTTANSSGQVVIQFTAVTQNPKISGITVAGGNVNPTSVPPTNIPPTGVPPTSVPPTGIPPTGIPPTGIPPTGIPPTGIPPTGVPPASISINAGGSATGSFTADQYYSGGSTYTNTATIDMSQITSNPPPAAIFNTERYGAFTYTIPNRSGAQTVTLYFSENYVTAAGQRLFNVTINGATALSNFDIYASAGGQNRAIARTFNTTANSSGQVVIQFTAVTENPKISGITVAGGNVSTFTLTVTKTGSGSGTVSSSPAGINSCSSTCSASFPANTSVTLTQSTTGGSTFGGWSGACSGTGGCTVTLNSDQSVTATFNGSNPTTFNNPVLWEDLADIDIIRVGNVYYYSASTMHYSPGAPILRSYDLVNWEFVGHSVPTLPGSSTYNLSGGRAYVSGVWASSLAYRSSNSTYYWIGCLHNAGGGHVYTSSSVQGPWTDHATSNCYYDVGLLVDTDNTMYVAYGNTQISVAQLSADGFSQVRSQQVYSTPSDIGTLEGSRFYKINGNYYIFVTRPANGQYVLKSSSPWGPYTIKQLLLNMGTPISGGGVPHQGGMVQTQNGDWYYMAFVDSYPGGRIPVLAPITWGSDGFPVITTVNGAWGATYPFPNLPYTPVKSPTGTDTFSGTALGPEWEWNHNPDTTKFSVNNKLTLQTATVTNDLYQARNTLSHRVLGPTSTATIVLNYGSMKDGDRAGFALLRDSSAWIGIKRDSGNTRVVMETGLTMDSNWNTTGTGSDAASANVSGGKIWLRIAADIHPGTGKQGRFYYSTDGTNFTQLGTFTMGNAWQFFMGYRYAIFNYATQSLGGLVTVDSFTMTTP